MKLTQFVGFLFFGLLLAVLVTAREINLENDVVIPDVKEYEKQKAKEGKFIAKREVEDIYLKVFVLIDYSLYQRWLQSENNEATQTMRYFYAHVINEVDNKFSSIDTGSYRYKVSLVGYYIAQTLEKSNFTESSIVKTASPNIIKFNEVLKILAAWVSDNKKMLPYFGVLATFTTYEDPEAVGMAYLGTACNNMGVTINHSGDLKSTANIVAHEIGHVLGSNHDGEGNTCNKNEYYLLTPVLSVAEVTNYHTFSSCSRAYFEGYISSMESSLKNMCFKNESNPENENIKKYLEKLPGQKFTPDQNCQLEYGRGSFYCSPGANANNEICQEMACYDPTKKSCFLKSEGLDGTPCGNKSWCIDGKCINDDRAPIGDEYCMYGDVREVITFDNVPTYCTDMVKEPGLCYYDFFEDYCCKTCQTLANPNDEQCKYGDRKQILLYNNKEITCQDFKNQSGYCYISSFRGICCKTCSDLLDRNSPDCPYGDYDYTLKYGTEILKCPDFKRYPFLCKSYRQKCCKTCSGL